MPSSTPVSSLEFYLGLMEEIKLRIDYINQAIGGRFAFPHQLTREFCFLQLRMIFELIAVACLCANSRHINVATLEKQWNANEIIARLSSLNPEFFPKAVLVTRMPHGFDCVDITPEPMSKKEFLNLYGRCGASLHRGSLRKISSSLPSTPVILADVQDTLSAIVKLLNSHRIPSPDLKTHYICNMMNGPDGKAAMITAEL